MYVYVKYEAYITMYGVSFVPTVIHVGLIDAVDEVS